MQQLTPNDLLVAASPYSLMGYHRSSASPSTAAAAGTASESISSSNRTGLLSTVTDAVGTVATSSAADAHQPASRHGNLDWLIHSLNTNLPDPATLIREPNLTPNLKHMISHNNNNGSPNGTRRSHQNVALADDKSPLNQHHSNRSSPARNLGSLIGINNSNSANNRFPSVSCTYSRLFNA